MKLKRIKVARLGGSLREFVIGFAAFSLANAALAQGFAARIGPPNFELRGNPGERLRQIIHIQNDADTLSEYVIRSADWDLSIDGGVDIVPANQRLAKNSCRQWVRLERPRLQVAASELRRYRFEVQIPESAQSGECRFAVLIGPAPDSIEATNIDGLNIPIAGQIAVIVYVVVGDAAPKLEYLGGSLIQANGRRTPALRFTNTGTAHGRPFGSVNVTDAGGAQYELVAIPFPILPGRAFDIQLQPHGLNDAERSEYSPSPPLSIQGRIEWNGGTMKITDTISQ